MIVVYEPPWVVARVVPRTTFSFFHDVNVTSNHAIGDRIESRRLHLSCMKHEFPKMRKTVNLITNDEEIIVNRES